HPDLFWYGIHPTEALFTVMGPGCESLVRTTSESSIVVTGKWANGRIGTLHGICNGKADYKLIAFGSDAIVEQKSGGSYAPMLQQIMTFFASGKPPVSAQETLEIYAFMEGADESKRMGDTRISIADILEKNGWTAPG